MTQWNGTVIKTVPFFIQLNLLVPFMKNSIILSLILTFATLACLAAPAKHVRKYLTLKDGTKVMATLTGDENGHWYIDDQGRALAEDSLGIAYYISSNNLKAHKAARKERMAQRNNNRKARIANAKAITRSSDVASTSAYTGDKKGLIILVNFKDKKFTYTREDFDALANQKGYDKYGAIGSLSDYFRDQSYGKLNLQFDVVGPFELSNKISYYGTNENGKGDDTLPGDMIIEAVRLADKQVYFPDYDWNHDGKVDQVYVVYAGYSEEQGAPSWTMWSHEWDLESAYYYNNSSEGSIRLDNVWIDTYACSSELKNSSGTIMSGIGTMCHEFSHCLGLPDLYDTNDVGFGMSSWSVLDNGSYNEDGDIPCGYTSYERWMAGWLEPIKLTTNTSVTGMKAITDSPEAYVIYNDANPNEYFLLENRQLNSWDIKGEGHGMLVLHVDYDEDLWYDNKVNEDSYHQHLTIFNADNKADQTSLSGDPYPGTSLNTSLTDTSRPAAKLFNPNKNGKLFMQKPITNISETSDGLINFTFTNLYPSTGITDFLSNGAAHPKVFSPSGIYLGTNPESIPQGPYKVVK